MAQRPPCRADVRLRPARAVADGVRAGPRHRPGRGEAGGDHATVRHGRASVTAAAVGGRLSGRRFRRGGALRRYRGPGRPHAAGRARAGTAGRSGDRLPSEAGGRLGQPDGHRFSGRSPLSGRNRICLEPSGHAAAAGRGRLAAAQQGGADRPAQVDPRCPHRLYPGDAWHPARQQQRRLGHVRAGLCNRQHGERERGIPAVRRRCRRSRFGALP